MGITDVYINKNSIFIFGRVKDLRQILAEYSKEYKTVTELIHAKLN
ncbi:Z-ring formation inhibitor MciZ [Peptococcaceae bacterium 1198_IL3148]